MFPDEVNQDLINTFDTFLPLLIINPVYKFDNKYFKNTILEAYEVYAKHDGIYVKFVAPNDFYVYQIPSNKVEQRILYSYVAENGYHHDYFHGWRRNYSILLKSLRNWICAYNNTKIYGCGEIRI